MTEDSKWDIEQMLTGLNRAFFQHDVAVLEHVEPFAQLMKDNPDKGIDMISKVYNHSLNQSYTNEKGENMRAFIEAIAGGPLETVPWAVYNSVGAVYPYLERPQQDKALQKLLKIWDGINYGYVNGARSTGHTTGIREPLLLADIHNVRPLYWPGLDEARLVLKQFSSFEDLAEKIIDKDGLFRPQLVNSDFQVGYGLLRSDFCSYGEQYVQRANPSFLERTVQGITWMRFGRSTTEEDIEEGRKRLHELLPTSVHEKVELYRQKGGWADPQKFC